ncbi:MAG TPA: hypothetical protein VMB75_05445, partial [Rhodocyclaceae bacterium]|nr:hypothetical protein [Rhodocyclaceae bacterium]
MLPGLCAWAALAGSASWAEGPQTLPYAVVGTGQAKCYDSAREISCPRPGQPFYGQDAQHPGRAPAYRVSADGLTVLDANTGLTWQRSPDPNGDGVVDSRDKLTVDDARRLP